MTFKKLTKTSDDEKMNRPLNNYDYHTPLPVLISAVCMAALVLKMWSKDSKIKIMENSVENCQHESSVTCHTKHRLLQTLGLLGRPSRLQPHPAAEPTAKNCITPVFSDKNSGLRPLCVRSAPATCDVHCAAVPRRATAAGRRGRLAEAA
jgi:hypothetical protein